MSFQRYESRPITRLAHEIGEEDVVWTTGRPSTWATHIDGRVVSFKAYEEPSPGDFVIRRADDETYHCRREVFLERNIVPEHEAQAEEETAA